MASTEPKVAATEAAEDTGGETDSISRGTESIETEKRAAEPVTQTSTTDDARRDENAGAAHAVAAIVPPLAAGTVTAEERNLDTDASKYSLEHLLQFQKQQQPIFSRLDFTQVKPDMFNKLFPASPGQLLPPRGYRVREKTIHEWFDMTRTEQEKYKERAKKEKERQERMAKRSGSFVTPALGTTKRSLTDDPVVLALRSAPMAPPLSQPIPFLEGKLFQVKLYYQEVPEGFTDWNSGSVLHNAFPPFRGCSNLQVPKCLIQDAQTDQDKLTVISWWRFLTKDEQRAQSEALKRVYATPTINNRKLPPDFWQKIAELEQKQKEAIPKNLHGPIDPTGNDFYVRRAKKKEKEEQPEKPKDMSCRGWKGEKFEKLFQACFLESVKDVKMECSAKIMETIPVYESITKSKYAKDLVFMREGDDYILRSVACTKKRQEGRSSRFCPGCQAAVPHINHLKRNVQTVGDVEAQQKEQISSLKTELRSTLRREKRLREKLKGKPAVSMNDDDEPSPKKPRVQSSPRRLPMTSVPQHDNGYEQQNLSQNLSYRHEYGF